MPTDKKVETIVLMVDLQPKLTASLDKEKCTRLLQSICFFGDAINCLGIPTIMTEQVPEKLEPTHRNVKEHFSNAIFFQKDSFSAFGCEAFCRWVSDHGVKHIVVGGIETAICIFLTAQEAISRNLKVTVIADCVLGRREQDSIVSLEELSKRGVKILSSETILYSLMGTASHSKFREISKLVRDRC